MYIANTLDLFRSLVTGRYLNFLLSISALELASFNHQAISHFHNGYN